MSLRIARFSFVFFDFLWNRLVLAGGNVASGGGEERRQEAGSGASDDRPYNQESYFWNCYPVL